MTARLYWTCRRAPAPYLIAITLAESPGAAREIMCPMACVAPSELVSPRVQDQVLDIQPGEVREIEVQSLPSWRDLHGDRLLSRSYCEDIGYDPT